MSFCSNDLTRDYKYDLIIIRLFLFTLSNHQKNENNIKTYTYIGRRFQTEPNIGLCFNIDYMYMIFIEC